MEVWMQELNEQIEKKIGEQKLPHYQTMILPQITADFYKMLKEATIGKIVREEYRMEDASMIIILEGERNRNGSRILRAEAR
ncbi:MAG: hypothetical protein IK111_00145 [Lachnospiraceae bacterium]|nr:hypothetical protein [Lachnospiraceae bacterium]